MKKLRTGIIGCGNIFPMHAYSIQALENGVLTAVCDINHARAEKAAEKFGCKVFYDYKQLIDSGEIDIVHICTPHYLHKEMSVYALEKDLHVICEKPMAIDRKDGEEIFKAAQRSKGRMSVIFQNRYNPGSVFAKQAIKSGKLGRVLGGKIIVTWCRTQDYYNQDAWRGTLDQEGGGVIINQSIHSFDLARWLIDKPLLSVDASIANRMHPAIAVEDEACGILHFEDGIDVQFFTTNNFTMDDSVSVVLHMEKGVIRITGDEAVIEYATGEKEYKNVDNEPQIDFGTGVKGYWGVSHYKQIYHVYKAFIAGEPDDTLEEGFRTNNMICAIYENARAKL